jgi:hypothetical protein
MELQCRFIDVLVGDNFYGKVLPANNQPLDFFKCLLIAADVGSVPIGLPARAYKHALKYLALGKAFPAVAPPALAPVNVAGEVGTDSDDLVMVDGGDSDHGHSKSSGGSGPVVKRARVKVKKPRAKRERPPAPPTPLAVPGSALPTPIVGLAAPPAPIVVTGGGPLGAAPSSPIADLDNQPSPPRFADDAHPELAVDSPSSSPPAPLTPLAAPGLAPPTPIVTPWLGAAPSSPIADLGPDPPSPPRFADDARPELAVDVLNSSSASGSSSSSSSVSSESDSDSVDNDGGPGAGGDVDEQDEAVPSIKRHRRTEAQTTCRSLSLSPVPVSLFCRSL